MTSIWTIAGFGGHAVAAVLLASMAILTSRRAGVAREGQLLVVALAITALWSLRHAFAGALAPGAIVDGAAETMRNGAWLALLTYQLRKSILAGRGHGGRLFVALALFALLMIQLACDVLIDASLSLDAGSLPMFRLSWLLHCLFTLGALVLLHSLQARRDHPETTRREAWIGAALAFMWAFDFTHYLLAWLNEGQLASIGPMRGFVMALLAIMIAIGLRGDGERPVALSRTAALRLISVGIVSLYGLILLVLATLSSAILGPYGRVAQFSLLFGLAVAVLALLPSAQLRAWLRVEISKHLFAHRYDYRALWLRFAAAVAEMQDDDTSLDTRVTGALAQTMDAPSAILFLLEVDQALVRACAWNWPSDMPVPSTVDAALAARLAETGWVVDIKADWADYGALLPDWMADSPHAWALAPLIHREALVGAILLGAPPGNRRLDWEDLDLLRVICGEAAARLAEARSRAALAEAQRFEEFNRRFAFILHDLKNLVSQMLLLAGNAERHAANPAFREDMVLTLKETATRMTELLQRLGRPDAGARAAGGAILLDETLRPQAPRWGAGLGRVELEGTVARPVRADADALVRAIGHLVRNALDASPAGTPVRLRLEEGADAALIHVIDEGPGMSAAFVRDQLFRPFSSTKSNGFGLGAHEARLLVQAMGGALEVESVPGAGTRFTIRLPFAARLGTPEARPSSLRRTG